MSEYPTADVVHDMRGGATPDEVWGDDVYEDDRYYESADSAEEYDAGDPYDMEYDVP